jgi:hypothetical protein
MQRQTTQDNKIIHGSHSTNTNTTTKEETGNDYVQIESSAIPLVAIESSYWGRKGK